jgi:hypothetical protein
VLVAQGKLDEALKAYRDSLSIRERLAAGIPGDDMNLTSACAASRCFDTASTLTAKST